MHNQVDHVAFCLSWRQIKAPQYQMSHNPPGVKPGSSRCHWLMVACDSEVIGTYKGSAQPLFSLSYLSLSSFLLSLASYNSYPCST